MKSKQRQKRSTRPSSNRSLSTRSTGNRRSSSMLRSALFIVASVVVLAVYLYGLDFQRNVDAIDAASRIQIANNRSVESHTGNAAASNAAAAVAQQSRGTLTKVMDGDRVKSVTRSVPGRGAHTVSIERGTMAQLIWVYGCDEQRNFPRPIPDQSFYKELYDKFMAITGTASSSVPEPFSGDGFHVPYYIDHHPTMGRGVFVKERVAKDTIIWTGEYSVFMSEGRHVRELVLNMPRDFQCDIIPWFYCLASSSAPHGAVVGFEVDPSALMNEADDPSKINMREEHKGRSIATIVATRDIEAGEQLLMNYDDFGDYSEGWVELGLAT